MNASPSGRAISLIINLSVSITMSLTYNNQLSKCFVKPIAFFPDLLTTF